MGRYGLHDAQVSETRSHLPFLPSDLDLLIVSSKMISGVCGEMMLGYMVVVVSHLTLGCVRRSRYANLWVNITAAISL